MKINDTLEGNCNSIENLNAYLRQKGKNHNCYKAYTSLSRVVEIRDTKFLYLSNGETWNDVIDRNNFNSATNLVVNYGKCFSFSQDENVAMWMLYGGIDKLSGMIDFTKKGMHSILATNLINVGYFDGDGKFKTEKTLTTQKTEQKMRVGFGDSHGVKERAPSCYSPLTISIIQRQWKNIKQKHRANESPRAASAKKQGATTSR